VDSDKTGNGEPMVNALKVGQESSGRPSEVLYGLPLYSTDPTVAMAEATKAWEYVYRSAGGNIDPVTAADLARLAAVINELEARSIGRK